ncbi:DEAD/DEAH box helicase [Nanoarchaeota archaeon]
MIKGFEPRLYQQTILSTCTNNNTLVVLPTGLGKTGIGLLLAAHRLKELPKSKIVFLSPTKPLAQQHLATFSKHMDVPMELFTGEIKPEVRQELWEKSTIVFSTPQGFENDIISGRLNLEDVSLIVFDEAHRAVGDYAYVFIAQQYKRKAKNPLVLGLTASPGSDTAKIKEVCNNLYVNEIELRTEEDPDVKPYVQEMNVQQVMVEFPEALSSVQKYLKDCFKSKLEQVKKFGHMQGRVEAYNRKALLELQRKLHAMLAQGQKDFSIMKSLSLLAEAMKVQHAVMMIETQGLEATVAYMERLNQQATTSKVKAVQNLVKDLNFKSALVRARSLLEEGVEHPKVKAMKKVVAKTLNKNQDAKIIIFNQYRDQVVKIKKVLDDLGVKSEMFVGQSKKSGTGMSQKEQKATIEDFEKGKFNCILATSVAEEGLDIPAVDLVIFYEPIPSAIRTVQRRGRTGRQEKGEVVVLITKGTIDEAYRWSAHHKENRMINAIKKLKNDFSPEHENLTDYIEEKITIHADYREKGSGVIKELSLQGVEIKLQKLEVGDYLLSDDLCIEFKTVSDFVDSVIDGRLLDQLKSLRQYYKPLLVIEGKENIYAQRNIHPNAIRGMLATIMFNFNIPVFQTTDAKDTAGFLLLLAKREREQGKAQFQFHSAKGMTLKDRQEYIVAALPGIGNKLAKPLLQEFGSVKDVVTASEDDLKKVELIGKKKAETIRKTLDSKYEK